MEICFALKHPILLKVQTCFEITFNVHNYYLCITEKQTKINVILFECKMH